MAQKSWPSSALHAERPILWTVLICAVRQVLLQVAVLARLPRTTLLTWTLTRRRLPRHPRLCCLRQTLNGARHPLSARDVIHSNLAKDQGDIPFSHSLYLQYILQEITESCR